MQNPDQNEGNNIPCAIHKDSFISMVCLQQSCVRTVLMCQNCIEEMHDGHAYISLQKMKVAMDKFRSKKRDFTPENALKAREIKNWFEEAYKSFQELVTKMKKLSDFMEMVEHNLLFNADEATMIQDLETSINGKDFDQMQKRLSLFLRNFSVEPLGDSEVSLMSYQAQKNEFAAALKQEVDQVSKEFENFFNSMSQLERKYKSFAKPKAEVTEEQRNIEFGKQQLTPFYMNQMRLQQSNQKLTFMRCQRYPANIEEEQNYSMSIIEKQIQNLSGDGPRKLVFKLYSYLVFYHSLECDAFVPEPVLGGVVLKKVENGELKMPIRCVFCRLVRIKSFVEFYFRFELTTRFGKLCLFRLYDTEGNPMDLYAHEMCLLFSNYVEVSHETRIVNTASVLQAVAYAQQMQCNYCQLPGASTKCNEGDCPVSFHFNCIKQMKLVGVKLDPTNRYRYHCDIHPQHQPNYDSSDWFMSRTKVQDVLGDIYKANNRGRSEDDQQTQQKKK